jgi:hypothetical protein
MLMLDASAFEVAGFDPVSPTDGPPLPLGKADSNQDDSTAALALAGCAACQEALGGCAINYARAGAMSPWLAISVCNSMQRMTRRAFEVRAATLSSSIAYVLLGPARDAANRQADFESLAETMR